MAHSGLRHLCVAWRCQINLDIELSELRDEERRVLMVLNSITTDSAEWEEELPGDLLGEYVKRVQTKPLEKIEDLMWVFESMGFTELAATFAADLVERAYTKLALRDAEKLRDRLVRFDKRTANRTTYIPEAVYTFYKLPDGRLRWRHDRELRSFGLLSLISTSLWGYQEMPLAMNVLKALPPIRNEETGRLELDEESIGAFHKTLGKMNDLNITVSGERLGYNQKHPAYDLLLKAFPPAIDMAAYCHSLNSPVLPEGYMPNIPVNFKVLRDNKGIDLETDGSGWYNPRCPEVAAFVAKHGVVPFQFRLLEPKSGLFAKGVVFPCDQAEGIDLDWSQIKGRWKNTAKERREANATKRVEGCYVGALQAWDRPRKIAGSFEMLENIKVTPRTIQIVQEMVEKSMGKLFAHGVEGLVRKVAKKDPTIRVILEFLDIMRNQGITISPMSIPRVAEAVKDRLSRQLYKIHQGGAGAFPSYVARLDATVPPGSCVVSGIRPGKKIAGFRFPMILSQGLVVLKTIKPKAHHLVDGELPPFQIIMNPRDLTLGMQGDDDGDILGVTENRDIIELFSNKLDLDEYHIEPKGVALTAKDGGPLLTNSEEGLEYLKFDRRGPVGRCTVWRSRLLAVGDYDGARAMSIAIQECIDRAKRMPEWSNYELAANPDNWEKREDGWHFTLRYEKEVLEDGEIPMERLKNWVDHRLIDAGCIRYSRDGEVKAGDPLWWRFEGKRIDTDKWKVPALKGHENLVHVAARAANKYWLNVSGEFYPETTPVNLHTILRVALSAAGHTFPYIELDYTNYQRGLRSQCGLTLYADRVGAKFSDPNLKASKMLSAHTDLEKSLRELWHNSNSLLPFLEIWEHETSEDGNVNNAFRAICWNGSPVLEALGLNNGTECAFMTPARMDWMMNKAMKSPAPTQTLTELISKSHVHFKEVKTSEDTGIHLWDCPDCMSRLQGELVNRIRTQKSGRESRWLSELTNKLNH